MAMAAMSVMRATGGVLTASVWAMVRPLGVLLAACGGSSGPAPVSSAPVVSATPRLAPDDVEVAKVNGRPVWSSCVSLQAREIARGEPTTATDPAAGGAAAHAVTPGTVAPNAVAPGTVAPNAVAPGAVAPNAVALRARALDQCIAFELLAQTAEARGLAGASEVDDAVRAAAVNRLVEVDFEQRYRTPADLGRVVDIVMQRNEWRMHILQLRASTFARFLVAKEAPPEVDARAHALADRLAAELAGETGLYGVHLTEAARRIAEGSDVKLETADVRPMHQDDLVEPYARALYAIPEVGRIGPVARTQWGWDVVMWTGGVEARERSRDEVVAELFPDLRRHQFQLWVTQLAKQLGVRVALDPAAAARLDTGDAPGGAPESAPASTPGGPRPDAPASTPGAPRPDAPASAPGGPRPDAPASTPGAPPRSTSGPAPTHAPGAPR
jgi:hypothetical protein